MVARPQRSQRPGHRLHLVPKRRAVSGSKLATLFTERPIPERNARFAVEALCCVVFAALGFDTTGRHREGNPALRESGGGEARFVEYLLRLAAC